MNFRLLLLLLLFFPQSGAIGVVDHILLGSKQLGPPCSYPLFVTEIKKIVNFKLKSFNDFVKINSTLLNVGRFYKIFIKYNLILDFALSSFHVHNVE